MHNTLKKWLAELEEETVITYSEDINKEANQNMVSFGFNQGLLVEWGKDSVIEFITECSYLYSRKTDNSEMVFYAWFDEQIGKIRISAVSQHHKKLPFGCELNRVTLSEMVDGIYSDSFGLYAKYKLDIWQKII